MDFKVGAGVKFWYDSDTEYVRSLVVYTRLAELWPVYLAIVIISIASVNALKKPHKRSSRYGVETRSGFWGWAGVVSLFFLIMAGALSLAGVGLTQKVWIPEVVSRLADNLPHFSILHFIGLAAVAAGIVTVVRRKRYRASILRGGEIFLTSITALFMRTPKVQPLVVMEGQSMTKDDSLPHVGPAPLPSLVEIVSAAKSPLTAFLMQKVLERQQRLSRQQIESLKLYKEGAQELIDVRRRQDELSRLEERLRREAELENLTHQRAALDEEFEIEKLKEARRHFGEAHRQPAERPREPSEREKELRKFLDGLGDEHFWREVREKFHDDPAALDLLDRLEADRRGEEF